MARSGAAALRSEIDRLQEQLGIAERLDTAEEALAQAQAELTSTQQGIAAARTAIQAEEATLAEKHRAIADAQAILAEVLAEIDAKKRESRALSRIVETQIARARAQLHELVPVAPGLTEEERENA